MAAGTTIAPWASRRRRRDGLRDRVRQGEGECGCDELRHDRMIGKGH